MAFAPCRDSSKTIRIILTVEGVEHRVAYEPGESTTGLFGGNSNWRGPIWFPVNYLLIESLQKFHHYLGDDFKVECPTGSGMMMNLWEVVDRIIASHDAVSFFRMKKGGGQYSGTSRNFRSILTGVTSCCFYEYFHGDYWGWNRRQPSDGMDWCGDETNAAKRRVWRKVPTISRSGWRPIC